MKTIVINLQGGNMTNPNHPKVDQSDRVVPINLRQSGRTPTELLISTRVRKSPFWHFYLKKFFRVQNRRILGVIFKKNRVFGDEGFDFFGFFTQKVRTLFHFSPAVSSGVNHFGPKKKIQHLAPYL